MADVLIVCVREDETQAKALADMFEGAGFSVGGAPGNDAALRSSGAGIVVWSQASIRSRPFLDAAQRVVSAGKAVLACLIDPPPPDSVEHAPAFDLTGWTGAADDPSLDPLFFAVDRMVNSARAAVGATTAPAPPQFQPPPQFQTPPPSLRAPHDPPYARNPRSTQPSPPQTLPPGFQMRSARAPEPDPINAEAEHWRMIRHSKDPNDFFEYLTKYGPDGEFSEVAELRLKKLSPGAPSSEANSLRNAARAAQAEPRAYETPTPRRPDPPPAPPRRPEPPAAFEASRAYDPPPQVRPEPAPPPRPREVHFERDHRPIDDRGAETAKREGGGARAFLVLLLVGAAIIGGGFYLGMGDELSAMFATAPAAEDGATPGEAESLPPASAPEDAFASAEPAAPAPAPTPLRDAAPTRAERIAAERAAAQAARAQERVPAAAEIDPPTPAPQTSWTGNEPAGGGPVSLQPSTQASNVPSQVIPLAPPPSTTPVSTTPAETARPTPAAARGSVRWAQRPSAQRISALYPRRALREGANGSVMLDCVVRADFGPSCTVASESPRSAGFGAAALDAVQAYRAQPTLSDGSSAVGARTRISIQFQRAPSGR